MSTPEGKVKAKVKSLLKQYGAYQHWPVQTGYGSACLDCHGSHQGLYYAVETKAPGKTLTPRQLLTKDAIEESGGKVFIVGEHLIDGEYSGMEELKDWLDGELPF
jgi:hypothetical protein